MERGANKCLHHLIFGKFASKTKISDLGFAIFEEYVGRFEIAMHYFVLMHGGHASEYLCKYLDSFGL